MNLIQEEESDCKTCHTSIRLYHPEEADCSNCHADHSSGSPKLLLDKIPALCWNCHEENVKMESKHFPFSEGECLECHVAHGNKEDYFLAESLPNICLECHGEINELMERNFVHPPVEEDCTTCHSPHSSDFPKLLKDFISLRFYELYTPLKYQLCFQCHDRKDIFGSNSGFVKGDINLHKVHVQKRKGRTCFVCHDPHASDQGYLLRERIPFGKFWFIKLKLEEKNGQKSCLPSCHQKENYGK
ncbi:cytochrome c3 family protein [Candidatus Aminicenantes bacterium AC-335-L06]|nr:cytochrome c3 family protein [Candidatus Aminicenantes bacterium AC-335-L06]